MNRITLTFMPWASTGPLDPVDSGTMPWCRIVDNRMNTKFRTVLLRRGDLPTDSGSDHLVRERFSLTAGPWTASRRDLVQRRRAEDPPV